VIRTDLGRRLGARYRKGAVARETKSAASGAGAPHLPSEGHLPEPQWDGARLRLHLSPLYRYNRARAGIYGLEPSGGFEGRTRLWSLGSPQSPGEFNGLHCDHLRDSTRLKLLQGFFERMLFWTIVVVLGAVVLIVLQLLGYG
jgi:hypothetical protein